MVNRAKKTTGTFNVKTVDGINDFASMKEAVYRRYKRLEEEEQPLPQLVIIDGGKGQLGAALEAIAELGLTGQTTLVGLAKNEEELFFAGDQESLKLPYNSESLKLVRDVYGMKCTGSVSLFTGRKEVKALSKMNWKIFPALAKPLLIFC
jgi:excinuclease ABC subunit C